MRIGKLKLENPLILAPMAGVTCTSFRLLCKEYGAGIVCDEMIHVDSFVRKPKQFMNFTKKEKPVCAQLIGSNPELFAQSVKLCHWGS